MPRAVRRRYRGLIASLARHRGSCGGLAAAFDHFRKVTRSSWAGLFRCYDVEGLPRTNNDLEQFFGSYRYHTPPPAAGRWPARGRWCGVRYGWWRRPRRRCRSASVPDVTQTATVSSTRARGADPSQDGWCREWAGSPLKTNGPQELADIDCFVSSLIFS